MNPLNFIDAMILYATLKPHIPEKYDGFIDFISKMVDNMIATEHGDDYVTAVAIMNKTDMETVALVYADNSTGLLSVFVAGLEMNHFMDLMQYCGVVESYGR